MTCKVEGCDRQVAAKGLCQKHYLRLHRHGTTDLKKTRRGLLIESGLSFCPKCATEKLLSDFNKDVNTAFGVAIYCKSCSSVKGKRRYREYNRAHRNNQLKANFGITVDQYEAIFEAQDGVCAVCKSPPKDTRLAVDHCHTTGVVRGLLCSSCNHGLGRFKDKVENLKAAASYLCSVSTRMASLLKIE